MLRIQNIVRASLLTLSAIVVLNFGFSSSSVASEHPETTSLKISNFVGSAVITLPGQKPQTIDSTQGWPESLPPETTIDVVTGSLSLEGGRLAVSGKETSPSPNVPITVKAGERATVLSDDGEVEVSEIPDLE